MIYVTVSRTMKPYVAQSQSRDKNKMASSSLAYAG